MIPMIGRGEEDGVAIGVDVVVDVVVGMVIAFCSRVTAVCAKSRPLTFAPVFTAIFVIARMFPSKCASVPIETVSAACQ